MCGLVAFTLSSSLLISIALPAQQARFGPRAPLTKKAVPGPAHELHVTHVSLYKNGVGFFEHEGSVTGNAAVRLDLTSAQLDDVLQSLTALDLGGGHITGANYNSTTPLNQQLRTLPLSLGESPTEEALFSALRGARVQVLGSGPAFTGRILSFELRTAAEGSDNVKPVREHHVLTVIADTGATRSLELSPTTVVHLLDPNLRGDLNTYLQVIDQNRTEGVRHLVLTDHGSGTRSLHVSFLSEVPVWKSTYRLLLTNAAATGAASGSTTTTVQGFSVIDNTTGEDWNDVQLSLIAGSPQSFLQPLAQPIYDRRAELPIAANAQTTPQTHESAEGEVPPPGSASADLSSGASGGPASLFGSPTGTGRGIGGTVLRTPHNINMMKDTGPPPPSVTAGSMNLSAAPELYEQQAALSTAPSSTTSAFDDFFAYNLTDPVSIPRNGSALVPILQIKIPVESVTLWSAQDPKPLRALWLTNTSEITLDRGSFSVVENGAFAGEGLLDPVHPGERRLLSYATDQAVRIAAENATNASHVTSISVSQGVLHAATTEETSTLYTANNAAPTARAVIVEVPRRPGWTLDATARPAETTPNAYRFRLNLQPRAADHITVSQRHIVDQYYRLTDSSEEQLTLYLNSADPKLVARLQPIFQAKRRVATLSAEIAALRVKEHAINDDQKRLRDNLTALKTSAEERTLVRRYTAELNAQEDALNDLHHQIAIAEGQRETAQNDLDHQIATLQISESAGTSGTNTL